MIPAILYSEQTSSWFFVHMYVMAGGMHVPRSRNILPAGIDLLDFHKLVRRCTRNELRVGKSEAVVSISPESCMIFNPSGDTTSIKSK